MSVTIAAQLRYVFRPGFVSDALRNTDSRQLRTLYLLAKGALEPYLWSDAAIEGGVAAPGIAAQRGIDPALIPAAYVWCGHGLDGQGVNVGVGQRVGHDALGGWLRWLRSSAGRLLACVSA